MYYVVEGTHTDPNNKETLDLKTKKEYGPMAKITAEDLAVALIQKNIDDYYHRAWVIKK